MLFHVISVSQVFHIESLSSFFPHDLPEIPKRFLALDLLGRVTVAVKLEKGGCLAPRWQLRCDAVHQNGMLS